MSDYTLLVHGSLDSIDPDFLPLEEREQECFDILGTNDTNNTMYVECDMFFGLAHKQQQEIEAQEAINNAINKFLERMGYNENVETILQGCSTRTDLTLLETIECVDFINRVTS